MNVDADRLALIAAQISGAKCGVLITVTPDGRVVHTRMNDDPVNIAMLMGAISIVNHVLLNQAISDT